MTTIRIIGSVFCNSTSNCPTCWAVVRSRLPVGSSARSRSGALIRARAKAARCRSPPESSAGRCSRRSARPTRSSSISARWIVSARTGPSGTAGSSTFSSTRALRQEVMVLEDEADPPAAEGGQLPLVEFGRVDAVQQHAAAGRGFQRAQDAQERALARAAGAEDRQVLARIERQRHAAEDLDRLGPRGILLGDVFDLKFGHVDIVRRRDK